MPAPCLLNRLSPALDDEATAERLAADLDAFTIEVVHRLNRVVFPQAGLADAGAWSDYETQRGAYYRHLGERVDFSRLHSASPWVGEALLAWLTVQVYNAQVYNARSRDLEDCQRVAAEMLKTLRPDIPPADYVGVNVTFMVYPDAPGYQVLELATLSEQQAGEFDAYWQARRSAPYFVERRGNSWIVSRWDLTRPEQRALADMTGGVRWIARLGLDLFTPEGLSLADALLADPSFQSCRRWSKLMLIPAEPRLIADLLVRLLQAHQVPGQAPK